MRSLTLKDVPDALLERLRVLAAAERRSLLQQALVLIEEGVTRHEGASTRVQRQVDAWRRVAGLWASDQDVESEVSDLLAARTAGRDVDL